MRWLLHGNLSPAVAEALRKRGDTTSNAEGAGITASDHVELLEQAQAKQLDIITADPDLANAPFEHRIPFNRSIVFLQLEGGEVELDDAIDRLFERYKRLTPGRLYTVTATRVKIRQLPARGLIT
jgi:predicted nuclease of predicted toxin-antitoxin system